VDNWYFHPQWFSSFPSGTEQERHRLIIRCTPAMTGLSEPYPQNCHAPYINIKNKLYKNSLFLFSISRLERSEARSVQGG
jgi:hypothetical protein